MRRSYSFLPVALVLFALAGQALADIQPSFDHAMAAWRATDIVVAVDGKPIAGSLTVSEVWAGKLAVGNTLSLPQVSRLYAAAMRERTVPGVDRGKLAETSPQRVVLFLIRLPREEGGKTSTWEPAAETGGMKVSVAWLTKDGVYAFAQVVNPGPTVLTRYGRHTEATLREQVKGVLAIRSRLGRPGDELARARATIAMMKREMAKLMVERDSNLDKLVVAQKDLKTLAEAADQLAKDYAQACEALQKVLMRIEKQKHGGNIQPKHPIRAKVTAVDTKLGLVVINAGQHQGVKKGMVFFMLRDGKYWGRIIVDEVFPDVSACHYARGFKGHVEVGDDAATKLAPEAARPERVDPDPFRPKKVTAVDKKLGLVVIDAGQRQGVAKGMTFIVFRADQYIGKIIVDEIFPDISACHYIKAVMKEDVRVGDSVSTKLEIDF